MPAGGATAWGGDAGPAPEDVRAGEGAVTGAERGAVEDGTDDGLWTDETSAIVAAAVERAGAVCTEEGPILVEGAGASCCILLFSISKISELIVSDISRWEESVAV